MLFTIFTDLVIAVLVGTLLAMFIFVVRMGNVYLREYPVDSRELTKKVSSFTIEGPLFFGVSNAISSQLELAAENADIIVLNLMNIPTLDSTGAVALRAVRQQMEDEGKILYFAGIKESLEPLLCGLNAVPEDQLALGRRPILEVLEAVRDQYRKTAVSGV